MYTFSFASLFLFLTNILCIYSWTMTACLQAEGDFVSMVSISRGGSAADQLVGECVAVMAYWWLGCAVWLRVD